MKKIMNLKERENRHMGGLKGGKEIVAKLQSKKLKKSLSIRFMIFKLGLKNMPAGVLQEENMNQHVVSCLYLLKTPCEGRGGKGWFLLSVHECVHACVCVCSCTHVINWEFNPGPCACYTSTLPLSYSSAGS